MLLLFAYGLCLALLKSSVTHIGPGKMNISDQLSLIGEQIQAGKVYLQSEHQAFLDCVRVARRRGKTVSHAICFLARAEQLVQVFEQERREAFVAIRFRLGLIAVLVLFIRLINFGHPLGERILFVSRIDLVFQLGAVSLLVLSYFLSSLSFFSQFPRGIASCGCTLGGELTKAFILDVPMPSSPNVQSYWRSIAREEFIVGKSLRAARLSYLEQFVKHLINVQKLRLQKFRECLPALEFIFGSAVLYLCCCQLVSDANSVFTPIF